MTNTVIVNAPFRDQKPSHESANYYPWFDWLRAVCACSVMLYHDGVLHWVHAGSFAVEVFFALSGWLIGGMLLNTEPAKLRQFYFNRAIRIWAPYYIAAALLLTLSVLREPVTGKWLEIVFYKLTFVYNLFGIPQLAEFVNSMPQKGTLSHFWSVNAEEQFYLVAPLILVTGARFFGRSVWVWILLAGLALVAESYAAIVLGVMAAVLVKRWGKWHLTPVGRSILVAIFLSGAFCLARDVCYAQIAPVTGLSIVLLLAIPAPKHRLGPLFGGMSYPLYLNHWIGVFAFNYLLQGMHDSPIRHFLSAVANIAFAMCHYWFIDRNLMARRANWFTPHRGKLVTTAAYTMMAMGLGVGFWMWHR
jgi:peptidoglycan/LPS O-acetylase OafA/YrhL